MNVPNPWDVRYSGEEYAYGTKPNEFLAAHAHRIPRGRVLSLADGEGRNGVFLAERGYDVTAVDLSAIGLAKARRLAESRGVRLTTVQADLAEFAIAPDSWEGIVSIFVHLPPEIRVRLYRLTADGLKPGGFFLLEAYRPEQLKFRTGGPAQADLLPSLADLRKDLAGLDLVHAVEMEREVREGTLHTGRAAVVQVAARKPAPGETGDVFN